ncbi:MAG: trehalose-binding protein [Desulfatibacillum sp.]|nr:trehalose-binding protein [Desulfatibacillum sp.]
MKTICSHTYEHYLEMVRNFHGHLAPGMLIGGFMVDAATRNLPKGEFFDAICETRACLPDAIQLLTPCTIGNGWLRVINMGLFALTLFEKFEGEGIRVYVNPEKLDAWPEVKSWFFKLKPKKEQDFDLLCEQIYDAGAGFCSLAQVQVHDSFVEHKRRKGFDICKGCGEAYPWEDGSLCLSCQGQNPYASTQKAPARELWQTPDLVALNVEETEGLHALHDMTRIIPGVEKGPLYQKGQQLKGADVCRLQKMGRTRVYVAEKNAPGSEWIHEDEAALAFAKALAGDGVTHSGAPREGKAEIVADQDGLLTVDTLSLEAFNSVLGVACAGRHSYTVVNKGDKLAGTRALPLYLHRQYFNQALDGLAHRPVYTVHSMRKAKVGVLVTGTEVFQGLVQDKFSPIIQKKVEAYGSQVVCSEIVADDRLAIADCAKKFVDAGVDLLVTTAGLSVDPDDVTRLGLVDAGAENLLYGSPILPGNMTLLADMGDVQVIGVPACALFHERTSFDLLLPRLLAGLDITRRDLAKMGHGSFCLDCKTCIYPRCGFGK